MPAHDLLMVINGEHSAQHDRHEAQPLLDAFRVFWLDPGALLR
ncbi:hypothetical protein [Posidoniimonas polymericola]|nr:hypothetical protein [Posidoniimonas polymericola]